MRKANATQGTDFALHLDDAQINALVAEYNADPAYAEMNKAMDEARIALVDSMVAVGRITAGDGAGVEKRGRLRTV